MPSSVRDTSGFETECVADAGTRGSTRGAVKHSGLNVTEGVGGKSAIVQDGPVPLASSSSQDKR